MKKILYIIMPLALIFPTLVYASWWNPSTWSWTGTNNPQSIEEGTPNVDLPPVKIESVSTSSNPVNPAIKTEIKTVYVDNPQLLIQINALTSDNKALNNQILNLQGNFIARLNACKDSLSSQASVSPTLGKNPKLQQLDDSFYQIVESISALVDSTGTSIDALAKTSIITGKFQEINDLLDGYKIADSTFSGKKIVTITDYGNLLNYMEKYVKYR